MEYNNAGNKGCLIGNWVEEGKLSHYGIQGKDTFSRVISTNQTSPGAFKSTTQDTLCDPKLQKNKFMGLGKGPKESLLERQFLRESVEEEKRRQTALRDSLQPSSTFASTTHASFVDPGHEFRASQVRKPRGGLKSTKKATYVEDEEIPDVPISVYTQRLVEGAFAITPATSTNPFARNSGFSNDVHDPRKFHLDCEDGAADVTTKEKLSRGYRHYHGATALQRHNVDMLRDHFSESQPDAQKLLNIQDQDLEQQERIVRVLSRAGAPLTHRQLLSVAAYCQGMTAQEFVDTLIARPEQEFALEESEEKSCSNDGAAFHYIATILRYKARNSERISFSVPTQLSKQRLSFPDDTPVIRAILRKQDIRVVRVLGLENA